MGESSAEEFELEVATAALCARVRSTPQKKQCTRAEQRAALKPIIAPAMSPMRFCFSIRRDVKAHQARLPSAHAVILATARRLRPQASHRREVAGEGEALAGRDIK